MNTPNKLTTIRMILTPIFLALFLMNFPYHYAVSLFIFIVGSLTDLFDGKIARKYNIVTNFGKLADPLADKMLTTAAILGFIEIGYCNIWVLFIILFREFAISSMRLIAASDGVVIPANMWGKVKTTIQMVASITVMLMLSVIFDFKLNTIGTVDLVAISHYISSALFWLMAAATAISGVVYVIQGTKVIDFSK